MNLFWLVPIAYLLHMVEETPRFIPWTKRYAWLFTSRFTMPLFLLGNGIGTPAYSRRPGWSGRC